MRKQLKSLILIGVSVVILLVSLLALVLTSPEKDDTEGTESFQGDSAITLIDTDKTPVSMYIKNPTTEFTIMQSDDGELYFAEIPEFNMYEGFLNYLWENANYLGASREIVATETQVMPSDEEMGLANPQATVLITYEDGSTDGFSVGNSITGDDTIFYIRMNGKPNVYVATLHRTYFFSREACFDDEIISLTRDENNNYITQNIDNIVLSGTNFPQTVKIYKNEDVKNATSIFYGSDYIITAPEKTIPDSTILLNLAYQVKQVNVNGVVCYNPTAEQLKQYGLNNPRAVISFTCNDIPYTLRAGNAEGVYTYLMMDGIDAIFSIQTSYCQNWSQLGYEDLRDPSLFPRTIASFKRITVTSAEGASYVFEVSVDDGEYSVTCNGKSIDFTNFQNYVSTMTLSETVGYGADITDTEPALTLKLEYFSSFNTADETVTLLPAGSRRYVCRIDGKGDAVVSATYIEKLLSDAEKLMAGKDITTY